MRHDAPRNRLCPGSGKAANRVAPEALYLASQAPCGTFSRESAPENPRHDPIAPPRMD